MRTRGLAGANWPPAARNGQGGLSRGTEAMHQVRSDPTQRTAVEGGSDLRVRFEPTDESLHRRDPAAGLYHYTFYRSVVTSTAMPFLLDRKQQQRFQPETIQTVLLASQDISQLGFSALVAIAVQLSM